MEKYDMSGVEDVANYFDYLTRTVQRNNLSITMDLNPDVVCFYDWVHANASLLKKILV